MPRRKRKGGQERQYCSGKCRQKAYRERNQDRFWIEKLIRESHRYPIGGVELALQMEVNRLREENGQLRFELMMLSEHELPAKQHEIDSLEGRLRYSILHADRLQDLIAERDAEIIRLNILLDSQSKKRRH
jgi:hypothetical protein